MKHALPKICLWTFVSIFLCTVSFADDDADFRPCNMNYQNPGNFRPWMGYDNSKGILTWQTYGQKLQRGKLDAPDDIRGRVEDTYPGFLDDPPI